MILTLAVTGQRVTVPMTNKQEHTQYLMRLSIQVRLDGLSFFTQNLETLKVLEYKSFPFSEKKDPAGLLGELKKIYNQELSLNQQYKEVDVVYVNTLFSLVPQALFQENKLSDYLKFNTKILETDFVAYDSLDEHDLVNVFIPYTNVNNFFFDLYGSFSFHHCLSPLINRALQGNRQNNQAEVYVNIHPDSFELIAVQNKELLFANVFEYHTSQDFIYYLLFTLEQLSLNPETVNTIFTGDITIEDNTYKLAYRYIRNVSLFEHSIESLPKTAYLLSTLL